MTGPAEPPAEPAPSEVAEPDWLRLDVRMLAVTPLRQLAGFLPVIVVVLLVGGDDIDGRVFGLVLAVGGLITLGVMRWVTTRYRITAERVELRSGLLFRTSRSVPRDRIRSVDLTAGPVHQIFGLSVVKIGTGERSEGLDSRELTLDAVSAREADRLRQVLLERVRRASGAAAGPAVPAGPASGDGASGDLADAAGDPAGAAGAPGARATAAGQDGVELARLDWAWLRYAPLTVSSLVAVGAVFGAFAQFFGELKITPSDVSVFGTVRDRFEASLWLAVAVLAVLVLVIAVLGSILIFVEGWWGFRLVREPGGTLRIRRGLLTTRSVSLEERRVRGVELGEPLLLRAGKGARLTAVATGLGGEQGKGRGILLPPAPREEAHRVAGAVIHTHPSPTRTGLRRHPRAALRRRLVRAVLPVLAAAAAVAVSPLPGWVTWAVLALLPATLLLGVDAYRNLGHGLTDRYLVTRYGAGLRHTVTLQRSGIIGWTVSQTFLQRRAGLVTLTATTAAGSGAYPVIDVGAAEGLGLAERAVPDLLSPFLVGGQVGVRQADRPEASRH